MNNPTILFNEKSYIKYFQEIINLYSQVNQEENVYTLFPFDWFIENYR